MELELERNRASVLENNPLRNFKISKFKIQCSEIDIFALRIELEKVDSVLESRELKNCKISF